MNSISKFQKVILKIIINSSGRLDSFTLFKRSKIDFSNFSKSIQGLIENSLIVEVNDLISINEDKKKEAMGLVFMLSSEKKVWRDVPKDMIINNIDVNCPYVPSRSLLDKKAFNLSEKMYIYK